MVSYWAAELSRGERPRGIPFADWRSASACGSFAEHPAGFDVFLPASQLPNSFHLLCLTEGLFCSEAVIDLSLNARF